MIVKIESAFYVEVKGEEEAEEASHALDSSQAADILNNGFPHGEIISIEVDSWNEADPTELREKGLVE